MTLYFKSAPQTPTLRCPKRSPEAAAAVGWLEGEGTIPPSSPGPEQEEEEGGAGIRRSLQPLSASCQKSPRGIFLGCSFYLTNVLPRAVP